MARLPIKKSGPLIEAFEDIPESFSRHVRRGFAALGKLPEEQQNTVLDMVTNNFSKESSINDPEDVSKILGISEEDAGDIILSLLVSIGTMSSRSDEPSDFSEAAIKSELINYEDKEIVESIISKISSKSEAYKESIERQSLASQVLPSLRNFEFAVDIRVGFDEEKIERLIPVAVMRIDADGWRQQMWLQMTRGELEKIVSEFQELITKMETVDLKIRDIR